MTSLVWVTGASRGIGRALASAVPWPDARVVGVSRTEPSYETVDAFTFIQADLSQKSGWKAVARSVQRTIADTPIIERVAFFHAAAIIHPIGFAGEVDPNDYTAAVMLNTVAPLVLGRAFLDDTAGLNCPRSLVMLTTGFSSSVYEGWSAYTAGKAAVNTWIEHEAQVATHDKGLRLIAVAPGVVDTSMQDAIRSTSSQDFPKRDRFVKLHAEERLADPLAVAARIWKLVEADDLPGPIVDLRDLPR